MILSCNALEEIVKVTCSQEDRDYALFHPLLNPDHAYLTCQSFCPRILDECILPFSFFRTNRCRPVCRGSKIKGGSDLVATTNDAFSEVATSASKVGELVGEIAAASTEQASGIEQVNKAVTEMDKITQENAANAEESASASEQMSAQAEQVKAVVGELVALVGGGGGKVKGSEYEEGGETTMLTPPPMRIRDVHKEKGQIPEEVIPVEEGGFRDF